MPTSAHLVPTGPTPIIVVVVEQPMDMTPATVAEELELNKVCAPHALMFKWKQLLHRGIWSQPMMVTRAGMWDASPKLWTVIVSKCNTGSRMIVEDSSVFRE